MKRGAWVNFPPEMIGRFKWVISMYLIFMVFSVIASMHLYMYSSSLAETIYGIIAFLASSLALLWQHIGMAEEKKTNGDCINS